MTPFEPLPPLGWAKSQSLWLFFIEAFPYKVIKRQYTLISLFCNISYLTLYSTHYTDIRVLARSVSD